MNDSRPRTLHVAALIFALAFAGLVGRVFLALHRVEQGGRAVAGDVAERADRFEDLLRKAIPWAERERGGRRLGDPGRFDPPAGVPLIDHDPNRRGSAGFGTDTGFRPPVGSGEG